MEQRILAFRGHIIGALDELERELHRTKADWEEKKGPFHEDGYVYRENLVVFEEELAAVARTRQIILTMDISGYTEIADYRSRVIDELKAAAAASVLLRSGIALIVRLVERMGEDTTIRPFCQ
jgi:hypothetical protein